MLDPKNMWMAMAAIVAVAAGWKVLSPPPPPPDTTPTAIITVGYGAEMQVAKLTRAECTGTGDRIWLSHKDGNDCLTVIVPSTLKGDGKTAETAIIFIDGDVPIEDQSAAGDERTRKSYVAMTDALTAKFGLPALVVARPGVLGSSGTHNYGGRRDDAHVVDAAIDELRKRYGIKRLVMAGQSGGSRLIAQLLVLGRRDISCAVLGSGAYDTPNVSTNIFGEPGKRYLVPMHKIEDIQSIRERRIFVVGDLLDQVTPFPQQKAWADALAARGHHAVLVETEARGEKRHGASRQSLEAAGLCAKGDPDKAIIDAARKAPG
jgi:pimeloyl-ACP methyl ester carboxylesterase